MKRPPRRAAVPRFDIDRLLRVVRVIRGPLSCVPCDPCRIPCDRCDPWQLLAAADCSNIDLEFLVHIRRPLVVLLAVTALVPLRAVPEGVRITTVVTDRQGKPIAG